MNWSNIERAWNGLTFYNKIGVLFFITFLVPCIVALFAFGLTELATLLN